MWGTWPAFTSVKLFLARSVIIAARTSTQEKGYTLRSLTIQRYIAFLLATLCLSTLTHAQLPTRSLSPVDAMLVLSEHGSQATAQGLALRGTPLRCTPGKSIGVWMDGPTPLTLQGLTITGCATGVVMQGTGHTVQGVTIPQATGGGIICNGCSYGSITGGTFSNAEYAIFLIGNYVVIENNIITDTVKDGILIVAGDNNTVTNNVIRGSGEVGIHLIAARAVEGPRAPLPGVRLVSWNNIVRGNDVQGNDVQGSGQFDLRQWPASCRYDYPGNTWENNTAGTRSARCLY